MAAKKSTKKTAGVVSKTPAVSAPVAATPIASTPVRNSPIPKAVVVPVAKKEITQDMIARRAYDIFLSGTGGSESDNWFRAERELRTAA